MVEDGSPLVRWQRDAAPLIAAVAPIATAFAKVALMSEIVTAAARSLSPSSS
jgi:hypothetical protein